MLLFGGNLSGGKKAKSAAVSTTNNSGTLRGEHESTHQSGGSQAVVLTPHTDALHRLTNHELRLLEELERTRSKLQAEWRLKVANLQRQQPEAFSNALNDAREGPVPSVEELEQRFQLAMGGAGVKSPHRTDLQHAMHSKTLKLSPNQRSKSFLRHKKAQTTASPESSAMSSNIRTGLDMLPVLTTTGETPFEVGLEAQIVPGQRQQQQQFVLPVFRLPSVNVASTASTMAAKEMQAIKQDVDRKLASETLGLSVEEIEALEAELSGQRVRSSSSSSSPSSFYQPIQAPSDGQRLPGLTQGKKSKRRQQQSQLSRRKNLGRPPQTKKSTEDGGGLRKELESALHSVQHLTRLVKDDICWAQKICPASELRTTLYFKRWGREKIENIFRRLLYNLQGVAMERWKQAIAYEKQQEKLQAYLLYKGSKKLDMFLLNWSQRKLRQAWTKWWFDIVHEKALERSALQVHSIQVIQRSWRAYRGRMLAYLAKKQKVIAKQTTAAIKMQRMFRGGIARKFFKLKRLDQRRQAMATRIQALARGYIVRKRAKQMQHERKKHLVASRVQALYRGRKARGEVAVRRRTRHLTNAAVLIQRRYRGRLGRASFIRRRLDRLRNIAATEIQTMVRGRRARKILAYLREEDRERQAIRRAAAINIQRVYRGHRARLSTELKLLALRERNRMYAQAATKIQNLVRKRQAIHRVERLRQERAARFVLQARTWVEYWNEDSAKWFYYNQETGEALWAPPATGYTKADGKLVLQDGRIIDPLEDGTAGILAAQKAPPALNGDASDSKPQEEGEEESDKDEDKLCVECEEEDARRLCANCQDVFCDACYEKLHHSAKREMHTWKAIGSLRCIECEKMRATRWCSVCEDPYCLGCFTIIHSKGNKTTHQWTDMATFKKARKQQQKAKEEESAQTYDEFLQSTEYQYVTEYAAAEAAREAREAQAYAQSYTQVYEVSEDYRGWMTLVDEASGQTYYYNSQTGESRWA
ncbi:Abnormal spindle-like microcephaly-associated protein-like protein [Phytophthora ramorum]|uniref:Abnormal spindle-like microcephaly-associated protein-like protein n=1 Tax=Phytophthora ramorum TaxID=164328 RepID=UPI0030A4F7C9|nr:Abnormal spindle-like microcephaly-associated protein-like protein [Phytophthora ramorum]